MKAFDEAEQRIAARTEQTSAELDARAQLIAETLSQVEQRLGNGAATVIAKVGNQISDAEVRLSQGAERIGEKLVEQVAQSEAQLVLRANAIAETFASVNAHIGQRTSEAAATLDRRTNELNEMLAARSTELRQIIEEQQRLSWIASRRAATTSRKASRRSPSGPRIAFGWRTRRCWPPSPAARPRRSRPSRVPVTRSPETSPNFSTGWRPRMRASAC